MPARASTPELAFVCGHSYLMPTERCDPANPPRKIRPPVWPCVLFGHFVRYVTSRGGRDEFVCVYCFHLFLFDEPLSAQKRGCPRV